MEWWKVRKFLFPWWHRRFGPWSVYYPNFVTRALFHIGYRYTDFERWRYRAERNQVMLKPPYHWDRIIVWAFPDPYRREPFKLPEVDHDSFGTCLSEHWTRRSYEEWRASRGG